MCGSGCRSVSLSGMETLSEVSLSLRTATPRRAGLSRRERAVRASQVLEALLQDAGAERLSLVAAEERLVDDSPPAPERPGGLKELTRATATLRRLPKTSRAFEGEDIVVSF